MKKLSMVLALTLVFSLLMSSASACTAIYVGGNLTADGTTMFARSEDISNSYNKLFYVSPAGNHKAGEVYQVCYGFTWTFTKDSYSYTAFSDDNLGGVCPDCGGEHKHTPYEAAGTNEMGVTVTATETLSGGSKAVKAVDPMNGKTGIEEAEIPTVLLSESATAKEAVDLLLSIYDNVGCQGGSGIFISDDKETWYIENVTGTQYVALKLNGDVAFAVPNQSVIGLIDLDDTENVIASPKLIEVAKAAESYVGDEAANTIDFLASYCPDQVANSRMVSAMKHFNAEADEDVPASEYTLSNVAADGSIVPVYSNIKPDHAFTVADMIAYYDIDGIGSTGNLEIHIFQVSKEDSLTDTVEWVAMDHGCYTVFVPYFPMLTTDTYAAYKLSTAPATFTQEAPAEGAVAYAATSRVWTEEGPVKVEGWKVLPENWAASMYWTVDALSNLAAAATDEQKAAIDAKVEELQQQCYTVAAQLADAAKGENAAAECTAISMKTAETVHQALVELVNSIK